VTQLRHDADHAEQAARSGRIAGAEEHRAISSR
jgi:hypothetical protein